MGSASSDEIVAKYREMGFFLGLMEIAVGMEYSHYLSAFLSAAYTLDEYMRKFVKFGFKDWAESDVDAELHGFLMAQRKITDHLGKPRETDITTARPALGYGTSVNFGTDPQPRGPRGRKTALGVERTDASFIIAPTLLKEFFASDGMEEFAEYGPLDATLVCRYYFDRMGDWLIDWERAIDG